MARTRRQEIYKCEFGEMEIRFDDPDFYFEFGGETTHSESLADIRERAKEALRKSTAKEEDWIPLIRIGVADYWKGGKFSVSRIRVMFGKDSVRASEWHTELDRRYKHSRHSHDLKPGKAYHPPVVVGEKYRDTVVYLPYDEALYKKLARIEKLPDSVTAMFSALMGKLDLEGISAKADQIVSVLGDYAPPEDDDD